MHTVLKLTIAQIRMYARDRQSVFFAFFFPLFFMLALGFMVGNSEPEPIEVSLVAPQPNENGEENDTFASALKETTLLNVSEETEEEARRALEEGERTAVIFAPEQSDSSAADEQIPLRVLVDAGKPQEAEQAIAILEGALIDVEHEIRGTEALFALSVEDVEARNLRYVDFLIPGLLAFMVMQLSIAGSGFNIVEYKRKGILKRLFVTPLRPVEFILSLISARLVVILAQITVLLLVAKLVFDIGIQGNIALLYLFVIFGSVLFLGIGFALGGVAKTQNAVMAIGNLVIFPQVFLSGIFFPIESLPEWIQPGVALLPLSFVSDALRLIANEGAGLTDLRTDILGILIWTVIGIFLAVRLFKWGEEANA